jgi:hypothetical protein
VFPPCCKPKIESTPTEHELYSSPSCSVRSATSVQCNFTAPTAQLHVAGVQFAIVAQLQFASCHAVCRIQNCTELASNPPIYPCPLTPFSNPIANQGSTCRGSNYSQDKLLAMNPLIRGFGLCKIGAADNNTITGPVGRLYLWRELNTRTVVDASSTQALTFPSSSFNVFSYSTPSQVSTSFLKVIQTF